MAPPMCSPQKLQGVAGPLYLHTRLRAYRQHCLGRSPSRPWMLILRHRNIGRRARGCLVSCARRISYPFHSGPGFYDFLPRHRQAYHFQRNLKSTSILNSSAHLSATNHTAIANRKPTRFASASSRAMYTARFGSTAAPQMTGRDVFGSNSILGTTGTVVSLRSPQHNEAEPFPSSPGFRRRPVGRLGSPAGHTSSPRDRHAPCRRRHGSLRGHPSDGCHECTLPEQRPYAHDRC